MLEATHWALRLLQFQHTIDVEVCRQHVEKKPRDEPVAAEVGGTCLVGSPGRVSGDTLGDTRN